MGPSRFKRRCFSSENEKSRDLHPGIALVAAEQGFEPQQTAPEAVVLPLHNSAIASLYACSGHKLERNQRKRLYQNGTVCAIVFDQSYHYQRITRVSVYLLSIKNLLSGITFNVDGILRPWILYRKISKDTHMA